MNRLAVHSGSGSGEEVSDSLVHSGSAEGSRVAVRVLQVGQGFLVQLHRVPGQPALYLTTSQVEVTAERDRERVGHRER